MNVPSNPLERLSNTAAGLGGNALAHVAGATAKLRQSRPLNPVGRVGTARLVIDTPEDSYGIPLVAGLGVHSCDVRWSRAIGLPSILPDLEGFALRIDGAGEGGTTAELLFASTGTNAIGRHVLMLRRADKYGPQASILPVRCEGGLITILLSPEKYGKDTPPIKYGLSLARGGQPWDRVGHLDITWSDGDAPERFDPVHNQLHGTEQLDWVASLREPSYLKARQERDS